MRKSHFIMWKDENIENSENVKLFRKLLYDLK